MRRDDQEPLPEGGRFGFFERGFLFRQWLRVAFDAFQILHRVLEMLVYGFPAARPAIADIFRTPSSAFPAAASCENAAGVAENVAIRSAAGSRPSFFDPLWPSSSAYGRGPAVRRTPR